MNQYNGYENMDAIERMKMRPPSWVNLTLVAANILVFLLVELTGSSLDSEHMLEWGAAYTPYIIEGKEYWRLFTSMFLHFGIQHLFNNMLLLFFLGDTLERNIGKVKYLILYLLSGVGGNLVSALYENARGTNVVSAGASGAVFAVVGAMIYILIANRGKIEELTTARMALMAALTLFAGFSSQGVDNAAHVGGLLCGLLLSILLYRKKKPHFRPGERY